MSDPVERIPVQRKRTARDLEAAVTLRPRDVFELYGIPTSTLHDYCTDPDESRRLPSYFIPGRKGKLGTRYLRREELNAWLERHRVKVPAA